MYGTKNTAPPKLIAAGHVLYDFKGCRDHCHGISGNGDGPAAHMQPFHPPRDFTNCAFQKEREDGELLWVLKYGGPETGMQRLLSGMLSEEEGWKVVAYIRTFCTAHS